MSYFGNLLVGSLKDKYLNKLKRTISYSGGKIPDYLKRGNYQHLKLFLKKIKGTGTKKTPLNFYLIISRCVEDAYIHTVLDKNSGTVMYEVKDIKEDNYLFRYVNNKKIKIQITEDKLISISKDMFLTH